MSDTPGGMERDPIDDAYLQAESVLHDEVARGDRRTAVLAALARGTPAAPAKRPAAGRGAARRRLESWRGARWLQAACAAGIGVFVALRIYPLVPAKMHVTPTASNREASMGGNSNPGRALKTFAQSPSKPSEPPTPTRAPSTPRRERFREDSRAASRVENPSEERAPQAFHAGSTPSPSAPPLPLPPVAAPAPIAPHLTPPPPVDVPAPVQPLPPTGASKRVDVAPVPSAEAPPPDLGAPLRAAAAAGRTEDLKALLGRGAFVDAVDAEGDTALMKSIRGGHPAAAALLRRYGASLDLRNKAGENGKDLAEHGDPALKDALGLPP